MQIWLAVTNTAYRHRAEWGGRRQPVQNRITVKFSAERLPGEGCDSGIFPEGASQLRP